MDFYKEATVEGIIRKEEQESVNDIIIEDTISYLNGGMCFNNSMEELKYRSNLAYRLKSLRPQSKQDVLPSLSEKEIICLKRALDYLRKEHNRYGGEDFTNEIAVLEWFITHPILVSDTHWKPSEEQMRALQVVVDEHWDVDGDALYSLYTDLKELM